MRRCMLSPSMRPWPLGCDFTALQPSIPVHVPQHNARADLKTANVMLQGCEPAASSGRGFVAKLGDFGLARMLGPAVTGDASLEGGGEAGLLVSKFGTVSHCPPETLRDNLVMLASDVYRWACRCVVDVWGTQLGAWGVWVRAISLDVSTAGVAGRFAAP